MRLSSILAAIAAVSATGCRYSPPEPTIEVENAWVQLPVVSGRPGAAYFTLVSNNDPSKLVNVTSPKVERIELHETVTQGGVARMGKLESLVFPHDELKLVFEPGGRHAMLFGIDPALRPGETIPLTFDVEPIGSVTIAAEVRAFGGGYAGH